MLLLCLVNILLDNRRFMILFRENSALAGATAAIFRGTVPSYLQRQSYCFFLFFDRRRP